MNHRADVRFEALTAVVMMVVFWLSAPCILVIRCQCFGRKHTVSFFRAEVAMLGRRGIYKGLEKVKAEVLGD